MQEKDQVQIQGPLWVLPILFWPIQSKLP
jgi:hypothetical protein